MWKISIVLWVRYKLNLSYLWRPNSRKKTYQVNKIKVLPSVCIRISNRETIFHWDSFSSLSSFHSYFSRFEFFISFFVQFDAPILLHIFWWALNLDLTKNWIVIRWIDWLWNEEKCAFDQQYDWDDKINKK